MTMLKKIVEQGLKEMGHDPSAMLLDDVERYGTFLRQRNEVMNLTAITDPAEMGRLHFLDSFALGGAVALSRKRVIDIGTGAGFPGLPLKLLYPDISLTLLDSLQKRVDFLQEAVDQMGLTDVACRHGRAEELSRRAEDREQFDVATSRAVAQLGMLCELCLPFVKPGGVFLAMKGSDCEEEVIAAQNAIECLGGRLRPSYGYTIPGTEILRQVVIIEKVRPTPEGYPRRFAKLQKSSL